MLGGEANLIAPPKLDLSVDRYAAFKAWKVRWSDFSILTKLKDKDPAFQCAMLRYSFTEETQKIYESLNLDNQNIDNYNKRNRNFCARYY